MAEFVNRKDQPFKNNRGNQRADLTAKTEFQKEPIEKFYPGPNQKTNDFYQPLFYRHNYRQSIKFKGFSQSFLVICPSPPCFF